MTVKPVSAPASRWLLAAGLLLACDTVLATPAYEQPATLDAAMLLPPQTLKSPHDAVQPPVESDGFINLYAINTLQGILRAASTAKAIQHAAEVDAAAVGVVDKELWMSGGVSLMARQSLEARGWTVRQGMGKNLAAS